MTIKRKFLVVIFFVSASSLAFAGEKIQLALNWKAEPQFGGFYAAQLNGEFRKRGLEVEILQGGSGTPTVQMLASQSLHFAVVSGDEIVLEQDRNKKSKVVALYASYQTSPCMIMTHAERGFTQLKDVFTHEGTLSLQSGMPYYPFLLQKWGKPQAKIVPYLGGIGPFLQDKKLSQQGFITSEPLSAKKAGVAVKSFLIADEGFNPYTTVLATSSAYLHEHPAVAQKIVQAVRAGWEAYLKDPTETNKYMSGLNKSMDLETFAASAQAQKELILTSEAPKSTLGKMSQERWQNLVTQLRSLKLIQTNLKIEDLYNNID